MKNYDKIYEKYVKYVENNQNNPNEIAKIPLTKERFIQYMERDEEVVKIQGKQYIDKFVNIWNNP